MLVKTNLQKNTEIILGTVHNNNLISSDKKSHLIVSSKEQFSSCSSFKNLGNYINNNLDFDYRINQLYKKASKKIHALARIVKSWTLISEECLGRRLYLHSFLLLL